ncbi:MULTISPECIES: hypothetical protein [Halorussus]|uniref:hypothetical protein n=1 Tax=Halorussus TaxID=1070314 RepID=UPI00209F5AFD|nr:hypothetical protein [Halorussus vallis]USZ75489.1 hypothetical protein NGM07_18910 [Halorussus vallis]
MAEEVDLDANAPSADAEGAFAGADDPLVVWTLATFHTAAFVAALVAALYLAGALGELLGGLSTLVGLALYVLLWAATWWTTRCTLAEVAGAGSDGGAETDADAKPALSEMFGAGMKWGGVDGVCFLWAIVVVALVPRVRLRDLARMEADTVAFFVFAAAVASLLAFLVGAVVGSLFALFDAGAFRVAARLGPDSPASSDAAESRNPDPASEP